MSNQLRKNFCASLSGFVPFVITSVFTNFL